jgi:acyl-CoA hydrolase
LKTRLYRSAADLTDALIASVGKTIVVGLPIGIGKAVHVVNALYERAELDPSISLTIFTGLTLTTPNVGTGLQAKLLGPIVERLYPNWPTPRYVQAIEKNALPTNIQVREFYLRPGAYLGNDLAQQSYASINYSQVVGELVELGVNVIAQLVAAQDESPDKYSLSSNPEITLDLLPRLEARRKRGEPVAIVGQVNRNLPYMFGDAEVAAEAFDFILDDDEYEFPLFGLPNRRVMPADYATGMHVASLIPDGGTLQLGIGSLSDAVSHCLWLRHAFPEIFKNVLQQLPGGTQTIRRKALPLETGPFKQGLFASTELLSDALLTLFQRDLIKRPADENDPSLIHAGFFVGSNGLYATLNGMPPERRRLINMTRISAVNTLLGEETIKRRQRRDARFVNETMMATLLGAAVSDSLDDGRVVSGVGGQFDFVSMALSLDDARSILMLRASRTRKGISQSNIRWSYGHTTVPRHHRDIYVSEYGIAATRGKTDSQVIEAMLQIADSDFQPELLSAATAARKLRADYQPPEDPVHNTAAVLRGIFDRPELKPHFPAYPLGTDLTDTEQQLIPALEFLQASTINLASKLRLLAGAVFSGQRTSKNRGALERLGLDQANTWSQRLERRLVSHALNNTER